MNLESFKTFLMTAPSNLKVYQIFAVAVFALALIGRVKFTGLIVLTVIALCAVYFLDHNKTNNDD
jgi:hypothetical protein